jgi:hypothetical protein
MFKRVRWMGMGAVAGVGASAWAQRRLRQTLAQHPSLRTGADAVTAARHLGREVGAALVDGRQAMAEREAALRAELDARRRGPSRAGDAPDRSAPGASDRGAVGAPPGRGGGPRLRVVDATASVPRPPETGPVERHGA